MKTAANDERENAKDAKLETTPFVKIWFHLHQLKTDEWRPERQSCSDLQITTIVESCVTFFLHQGLTRLKTDINVTDK